jgi:hypothetical protein
MSEHPSWVISQCEGQELSRAGTSTGSRLLPCGGRVSSPSLTRPGELVWLPDRFCP